MSVVSQEELKEAPVKKRAAWEGSVCEAEQDRAAELTQGKVRRAMSLAADNCLLYLSFPSSRVG